MMYESNNFTIISCYELATQVQRPGTSLQQNQGLHQKMTTSHFHCKITNQQYTVLTQVEATITVL